MEKHNGNSMKRVLFLTSYFPPLGGAGVQRASKFTKYLSLFGWQPTVLTFRTEDQPIHMEYQLDRSLEEDLTGKDYHLVQVKDTRPARLIVALERSGLFPLAWFVFYRWFWEQRYFWAMNALKAARRLIAERTFDAILTTSGPYSLLKVGCRLTRESGIPWIADLRDPWTAEARRVWPSKAHWLYDCRRERQWLGAASRIVTVTEGMKDLYARFLGPGHPSIHVIHNGYDIEDFENVVPAAADARFTLTHTGAFSKLGDVEKSQSASLADRIKFRLQGYDFSTHTLMHLFGGMAVLFSKRPEVRTDFHLNLVGYLDESNMNLVQKFGFEDVVTVRGYLPHNEAVSNLVAADALFLPLYVPLGDTGPSYRASGKIFEYLAARKPVLGLVPDGNAKDILTRARVAFVADPRDHQDIARVLEDMIDRYRAGTLRVDPDEDYIQSLSRRALTAKLAELLDEVSISR